MSVEATTPPPQSGLYFVSPEEQELAHAPPRCLSCNEPLLNADPDKLKCPVCGRHFDPRDRLTFTYLPPISVPRLYTPGAVLAAALFVLTLVAWGGWTRATLVAVGAALGYAHGIVLPLILGLLLATAAVIYITFIDIVSAGASYAAIPGRTLIPAVLGAILGIVLRRVLKRTRFEQKWYLP